MSDIIPTPTLPADPPEEERTSNPKDWGDAIGVITDDFGQVLGKYVSSPESAVAVAPSIGIDAAGVPVATVPLTKKTKAIISGIGSTVTSAATGALLLFGPDTTEAHILTGIVAIVGILSTTFGVHQATNLPDLKKAGKHVS